MKAFLTRNCKELLRDPISYFFCIGFPLVMLVVMTLVNRSIPPQAGMTLFEIQNLAPGILVFGSCFVMLSTALLLSKDRCSALLLRLYASPMRGGEFLLGYTLPLLALALIQAAFLLLCGDGIRMIQGDSVSFLDSLVTLIAAIPVELCFLGLGMLIGSCLNDKAAPGICSIGISLASLLGGIWMDVEAMGGGWFSVCRALPFYPAVSLLRCSYQGDFSSMQQPLLVVCGYAIGIYLIAVLLFSRQRRRDLR
jgi:ABC-2 type transport system permease protein